MQVWYALPSAAPRALLELARQLDETGLDGVAISDHLCIPSVVRSGYPYAGGRPAVFADEMAFSDPLTLIAGLGVVAPRLRFMTSILIAPLWHPLMLARQAATTSELVNGRLDLGVAAGWMSEEFAAAGVPFQDRGGRLDEALPLLRRLWADDDIEHEGSHFRFDSVKVGPRPTTPIPILVGGHGRRAIRRAARLGDGWIGVNPTDDELRQLIAWLTHERAAFARPGVPFSIRTGVRGELTDDRLAVVRSCGVDALVVLEWQLPPACRGPTASASAVADALAEIVIRVRHVETAIAGAPSREAHHEP